MGMSNCVLDEQERRHQKMVEWVWVNEAGNYGWLDDDHEAVEQYAAELIEAEDEAAERQMGEHPGDDSHWLDQAADLARDQREQRKC